MILGNAIMVYRSSASHAFEDLEPHFNQEPDAISRSLCGKACHMWMRRRHEPRAGGADNTLEPTWKSRPPPEAWKVKRFWWYVLASQALLREATSSFPHPISCLKKRNLMPNWELSQAKEWIFQERKDEEFVVLFRMAKHCYICSCNFWNLQEATWNGPGLQCLERHTQALLCLIYTIGL